MFICRHTAPHNAREKTPYMFIFASAVSHIFQTLIPQSVKRDVHINNNGLGERKNVF